MEPLIIDLRRPPRRKMNTKARLRVRKFLMAAQGGICAHCEEPFPDTWEPNAPDMPTIDHVEARSRGGGNGRDNLLLKHKACNEAGGSRPPSPRDRRWQAKVRAFLDQEAA